MDLGLTQKVDMLNFIAEVVLSYVLVDIQPLTLVINELELIYVLVQCLEESIEVSTLPVLSFLALYYVLVRVLFFEVVIVIVIFLFLSIFGLIFILFV